MKTPSSPFNYKTRFGLYKAVTRVLDEMNCGTKKAWWLHAAKEHCQQCFPDLWPQLNNLITSYEPQRVEDLREVF